MSHRQWDIVIEKQNKRKKKDKKEMQFPFHNVGESIKGLLGVAGRWSLWGAVAKSSADRSWRSKVGQNGQVRKGRVVDPGKDGDGLLMFHFYSRDW